MLSLVTTGILGGSTGLPTDGILGGSAPSEYAIASLDPSVYPDDGGILVTARGTFPPGTPMKVFITTPSGLSRECYAGFGAGGSVIATGGSAQFVVPPMPVGGPYELRFDFEGESIDYPPGVTYVHRDFTSNLFALRGEFAPPRSVGPFSLKDET